jgi:hypothetical protein
MKLDRTAYRTVPASALEDGTALEPLTETVTYAMVVMSASATWTFFGGHTDTAYAQLQGRRDIYLATGPINGLVDRYLADRIGPEAFLRKRKVTMRESICAGDTITIEAAVTRRWLEEPVVGPRTTGERPHVEVGLRITNQLGAVCVSATAVLQLPAEQFGAG